MDKTKVSVITGLIASFILGGIFQRYIGVNPLLILLNIRTIEYADNSNRTLVDSRPIKPLVILIAGQSNVANTLPFLSKNSSFIYNFYNGKLYFAKDPLLGSTDNKGSLWIRAAERIVAQSTYNSVVLMSVARSNSSINDWIDSGKYNNLISRTYSLASSRDLTPDIIIWGHGERDSIDGMRGAEYSEKLQQLMNNITTFHQAKPIVVSITSKCYLTPENNEIRDAQYQLINNMNELNIGPDTDRLGPQYRYDNCHFNNKGSDILVSDWTKSILHSLSSKKSEIE